MEIKKKPSRFLAWSVAIATAWLFSAMLTDGAVQAAFGFTGLVLLGTGIWHRARGSSWLAGLDPTQSGTLGKGALAIGAVSLAISVMLPASTISAMPVTAGSSAPSAPEPTVTVTVTASVTVTPTPSPSPSTQEDAAPSPSVAAALLTAPTGTETSETVATALAVLGGMPVKGRAAMTGYDRALFGQQWADVDRNGCDTRNDILKRDLTQPTFKPGTDDCVVLDGLLNDPYTGSVIDFGQAASSGVQVDHVVALGDAWQKGAQQLDLDMRTEFANDPLNLLAVDGPTNLGKGNGDAATWLPPNKSFRCDYVARQTQVKAKYGLWMTQAEAVAIFDVLRECAGRVEPSTSASPAPLVQTITPTPTVSSSPTPAPAAAPVEQPRMTAAPTTARATADTIPAPVANTEPDAYYKNCTAAKVAGAAPLFAGDRDTARPWTVTATGWPASPEPL